MKEFVHIIGRDAVSPKFVLGEGESLKLTFVALPGQDSQLELAVDLTGPGASFDAAGVYVCDGSEKVSIKLNVRHISAHCHSSQLFKGVVGGSASVNFNGLIYVAPDSQKTEAYQASHSLLLGSGATVETAPQLEIYADDVVCSHGATVGYLDADEQFYMRSRGIPEAEAKRLQILSFLSPVLSRLPEDIVPLLGL